MATDLGYRGVWVNRRVLACCFISLWGLKMHDKHSAKKIKVEVRGEAWLQISPGWCCGNDRRKGQDKVGGAKLYAAHEAEWLRFPLHCQVSSSSLVLDVLYQWSIFFQQFLIYFFSLHCLGASVKKVYINSISSSSSSSAEILSNSCSNLTLESLFFKGLKSQDYKIPLGLDTYETSVATPLMPQSYILKDFHSLTVLFMCPSAC